MRCFLLIIERFQLFSYYLREVVIPTLLSKILLYLPVDVAQLGEPRKFLYVSFLILSYPLPFVLSGLHASILTRGAKVLRE